MYRLHGYAPDTVEASTEQTLSQVHPHDLHDWVDAMHAGMQLHQLVVHEHRVVDRSGRSRPVLLVAYPAYGADGPVTRVDGLMLPLDEEDASGADEAPELVLLVTSTFDLGQVAARTLLRRCAPVPAGWGRHRLQVVGEDGLAETPSGSLPQDVAATLFPQTPTAASAS